MQSLQEHDSSVAHQVCIEQESLPNKDQKQSKRNYMSLVGRDVIALSGLVEHNLNQPPSIKLRHVDLGKMTGSPFSSISEEQVPLHDSSYRDLVVGKRKSI